MAKRSSRRNESDDGGSQTRVRPEHRRNFDPSPYVAPHDGMGVYDHGQRDGKSLYSGGRTSDSASRDEQSSSPTPSLLQREAKDERPGWVEDGSADVPSPVHDVLSSSGRGLCGPIQRDIEEKMGEEFGDVRIHTGQEAAEACEAVNARAFTAGNHIVFNSGEFDPGSPEGKYVLAHEMAHVKQQTGGALSLLPQADSELEVDPDPALEREADEAATEALRGEDPQIQRLSGGGAEVHVQRLPEEKVFDALTMFHEENDSGDVGDFQQSQNANRIAFLQEVVADMLDKGRLEDAKQRQAEQIREAELDAQIAQAYTNVDDEAVIEDIDESRTKDQLQKRPEKLEEGQENIESMLQQLTQGISDKLEQVGLTDEQRRKLDSFDGGEVAKAVGWETIKGLISLVPGLGAAVAAYSIAETTLQQFWEQTDGSIADRLRQVKEAVFDQVKTGSGLEGVGQSRGDQ